MSELGANTCRCGHEREAHDHYRAGTECALCGAEGCPRYRDGRVLGTGVPGLLSRVLHVFYRGR